jgi:hypothetical protein
MNKKLCLGLTIFFSLTINFSAKAYSKKDLEKLQTNAAIAEFILNVPFFFSEPGSNDERVLSWLAVPATLSESICAVALENDTNLIAAATRSMKLISISSPGYQSDGKLLRCVFMVVLPIIANAIIKSQFRKKDECTQRRLMRAIVKAIITCVVVPHKHNSRLNGHETTEQIGWFLSGLIAYSIYEIIGEKVIQNTNDELALEKNADDDF